MPAQHNQRRPEARWTTVRPTASVHELLRSAYLAAKAADPTITHAKLGERSKVSSGHVSHLLGPNPDVSKPFSIKAVMNLAQVLKVDLTHALLTWVRDTWPITAREIDPFLAANNPFPPGTLRRLALRSMLLAGRGRAGRARSLPAESPAVFQVARSVRERLTEPERRRLRNYLAKKGEAPSDPIFEAILKKLGVRSVGNRSRLESLDLVAAELRDVHHINTTLSTQPFTKDGQIAGGNVRLAPGCVLVAGHSPTIFGGLTVETFRVDASACAPPGTPPYVTLEAEPHPTWEIGVVLRGKVRLKLKDGVRDVIGPREYGEHAVVAFTSLHHHTIEFITADAFVMTINIRGNLLLGRRFADVAARLIVE